MYSELLPSSCTSTSLSISTSGCRRHASFQVCTAKTRNRIVHNERNEVLFTVEVKLLQTYFSMFRPFGFIPALSRTAPLVRNSYVVGLQKEFFPNHWNTRRTPMRNVKYLVMIRHSHHPLIQAGGVLNCTQLRVNILSELRT